MIKEEHLEYGVSESKWNDPELKEAVKISALRYGYIIHEDFDIIKTTPYIKIKDEFRDIYYGRDEEGKCFGTLLCSFPDKIELKIVLKV